jgi:hypothetical protein
VLCAGLGRGLANPTRHPVQPFCGVGLCDTACPMLRQCWLGCQRARWRYCCWCPTPLLLLLLLPSVLPRKGRTSTCTQF